LQCFIIIIIIIIANITTTTTTTATTSMSNIISLLVVLGKAYVQVSKIRMHEAVLAFSVDLHKELLNFLQKSGYYAYRHD